MNLTRRTNLFEGCSWFNFSNLRLALDMALKFCTSVAKFWGKFWGQIPTFAEVIGQKLVEVSPKYSYEIKTSRNHDMKSSALILGRQQLTTAFILKNFKSFSNYFT